MEPVVEPIRSLKGICTDPERGTVPITVDVPYEHTLELYVDNRLLHSIVCTPTYLPALVIGRLCTDGIIASIRQVKRWSISEDGTRADVTLAPDIQPESAPPAGWIPAVTDEMIYLAQEKFSAGHPLYKRTRGVHSCTILHGGEIRYVTEDLSRHNALDKAVGCALLDGLPLWECLLYSSGRVPQDMLQKGLTAGLRVFVAKAIPTWQSVQLARANGIVLICDARNKSYIRFSPEE